MEGDAMGGGVDGVIRDEVIEVLKEMKTVKKQ